MNAAQEQQQQQQKQGWVDSNKTLSYWWFTNTYPAAVNTANMMSTSTMINVGLLDEEPEIKFCQSVLKSP